MSRTTVTSAIDLGDVFSLFPATFYKKSSNQPNISRQNSSLLPPEEAKKIGSYFSNFDRLRKSSISAKEKMK